MKQFRVMTFNIRHGRGMDDVVDLERIAAVIRDAKADFVALNEVDRRTVRSNNVDQAEHLAQLLQMHSAYAPSIKYQGGQYGNAILSRCPIVEAVVHQLPNSGGEQRTALQTTHDLDGEPFTFFATHLGLDEQEQVAQLEALGSLLRQIPGPRIVAGDLNFDDRNAARLGHLSVPMEDAAVSVNGAVHKSDVDTFPSDDPAKRIDYVLLSPELVVAQPFVTIRTLASDHLPVVGSVRCRQG